jgi:hypothetical protein
MSAQSSEKLIPATPKEGETPEEAQARVASSDKRKQGEVIVKDAEKDGLKTGPTTGIKPISSADEKADVSQIVVGDVAVSEKDMGVKNTKPELKREAFNLVSSIADRATTVSSSTFNVANKQPAWFMKTSWDDPIEIVQSEYERQFVFFYKNKWVPDWKRDDEFFANYLIRATEIAKNKMGWWFNMETTLVERDDKFLVLRDDPSAFFKTFRSMLDRSPAALDAWEAREASRAREVILNDRIAIGDVIVRQRTAESFSKVSPIEQVRPPTYGAGYTLNNFLVSPRQYRDFLAEFDTPNFYIAEPREFTERNFLRLGPDMRSKACIDEILLHSPIMRSRWWEMMVGLTNSLFEINTQNRFEEFRSIVQDLQQQVTTVLKTSNLGAQLTRVASSSGFIKMVAAAALPQVVILKYKPSMEVRDSIDLLGCLAYVTMMPQTAVDMESWHMCMEKIFRFCKYHVLARGAAKMFPAFDPRGVGMPGAGPDTNAVRNINAAEGNDAVGQLFGNVADVSAIPNRAGPINSFLTSIPAVLGYQNATSQLPQVRNGVNAVFPYQPLNGIPGEYVGMAKSFVEFSEAITRFSPTALDNNQEISMFRGVLRLMRGRGRHMMSFYRRMTEMINVVRSFDLHPNVRVSRHEIYLDSFDLASMLFNLEFKAVIVRPSIYDTALAVRSLHNDLALYMGLNNMVFNHEFFARNMNKGKKKDLLNSLVDACGDWFQGEIVKGMIPLMNDEVKARASGTWDNFYTEAIRHRLEQLYQIGPAIGRHAEIAYQFLQAPAIPGLAYLTIADGSSPAIVGKSIRVRSRDAAVQERDFAPGDIVRGTITYIDGTGNKVSRILPFITEKLHRDTEDVPKLQDNETNVILAELRGRGLPEVTVRYKFNDITARVNTQVSEPGMVPFMLTDSMLQEVDIGTIFQGTPIIYYKLDPKDELSELPVFTRGLDRPESGY